MDIEGYPLSGIRILDFTQVMMGPCATQMLADFGADVIKIERPGSGDLSRNFFGETSTEAMNNVVYASLNRNKRSVEIDTKNPVGRQMVLDMVRDADVVDHESAGCAQRRLGARDLRAGVGFGRERLRLRVWGEALDAEHALKKQRLAQLAEACLTKSNDRLVERVAVRFE